VVGCSTATYFVRLHRARRRLERAMADPPECAVDASPDRAVADSPAGTMPGQPDRAAADPAERATPGPPRRPGPDLPGRTNADSPDAARLGHPVLAHRKERSL
jgi:RNA polymerase sigma-70 factor (ECF subfamily)